MVDARRHLRPRGAVRRRDGLHRPAGDVRARRQLPLRRRDRGVDRRRLHRRRGADAAAGAARVLRAARATAQGRRELAAEGRLSTTDESPGWSRWADRLRRRPAAVRPPPPRWCCSLPRSRSCRSGWALPTRAATRRARRPARPMTCWPQGFGPGFNGPLQLVAKVPDAQAAPAVRARGCRGEDRRRGSPPCRPCRSSRPAARAPTSRSPRSSPTAHRRTSRRPTLSTGCATTTIPAPSRPAARGCSSAARPRSSRTSPRC